MTDPEEQLEAVDAAPRTPAGSERSPRTGREATADELPWIDDRVSKVWVALIVAVFSLILLYGVLFGQAGLLTPVASPSPSPSPAATQSPAASPSPVVSPSPVSTPGSSPAASPPASAPPGSPSPAPS